MLKYEPNSAFEIKMIVGYKDGNEYLDSEGKIKKQQIPIYKEGGFGSAEEMSNFYDRNRQLTGKKKKKKKKGEKVGLKKTQLVRLKVGNAKLLGMTEEEVERLIEEKRKAKKKNSQNGDL